MYNHFLLKLTFVASVLYITSCKRTIIKGKETSYVLDSHLEVLQIITLDSCEYFYSGNGNGYILTHKGNCKNHVK